jgi:hypothetical protein
MMAYLQRALACAAALRNGSKRPRDLRGLAPDAAAILLRNFYGWFEREARGVYRLSAAGEAALLRWTAFETSAALDSSCPPSARSGRYVTPLRARATDPRRAWLRPWGSHIDQGTMTQQARQPPLREGRDRSEGSM